MPPIGTELITAENCGMPSLQNASTRYPIPLRPFIFSNKMKYSHNLEISFQIFRMASVV